MRVIYAAAVAAAVLSVGLGVVSFGGGDRGMRSVHAQEATPTPRIAFASNRDGNFEIYVMNADGSGVTQLTNNSAFAGSPAWSPDGRRIAFNSYRDGDHEIYVMNADGSGVIQLTHNSVADSGPVWSPDGRKIAFRSRRDADRYEIYVMNADGSGVTRLTHYTGTDESQAWSPDGRKIAFYSDRDGLGSIYVMNADGSDVVSLLTRRGGNPVWSPDGRRIVFTSWQDENLDIYVMDADGSGVTRLTHHPERDLHPAWSPDGRRIVFGSERDGNLDIYVMDADGSGVTRLTHHPESIDWLPAWGHVPRPTPTLVPTHTPRPTATLVPTHTPRPTVAPPTFTPRPTFTRVPTSTPRPPATPIPTNTPTPVQAGGSSPLIDIHADRTETDVDQPVQFTLSIVNRISQADMTVLLTMQVPSGWSIVGEGFADNCSSQCTARYPVQAGKQRHIEFTGRPNQAGQFRFVGYLDWFFEGAESQVYEDTKTIPVTVKGSSATSTPVPPSTSTLTSENQPTPTPSLPTAMPSRVPDDDCEPGSCNNCPQESASVGTASGSMLLLLGPLAIVGAIKYRRREKRCE